MLFKQGLRRTRLLPFIPNDRLQPSHNLHPIHRLISLLHRRRLFNQRLCLEMHRKFRTSLLRVPRHLRQNSPHATRLRSQPLHQHRISQPGHESIEQRPRKRNSLCDCHQGTSWLAYVPVRFCLFTQLLKTESRRYSRRHNRRMSLPLFHRLRRLSRLAEA